MSFELPSNESERGGPEPLAVVLRRGFAAWLGPCCSACGLPALLHGERCDNGNDGDDKRLRADVLQHDQPTGNGSPAGDARDASSSSEESR